MSDGEKEAGVGDYVFAGPQIPGREEHVGLRCSPDGSRSEVVAVAPMKDGTPLPDEAELLTKVEDGVFRVDGTVAEAKKGPARVNSQRYQDNWDRVFGRRGSAASN